MFPREASTFVAVPGCRPARDLGLHSPLVSVRRDALGGGASSAVCGMPRAGVFWKQYRAVRSGLLRRPPEPAAAAGPASGSRLPPPASRQSPVSDRAAGGLGGVGSHLFGEVGAESRCSWGPGKVWALGSWGDHEELGR
ncbi:Hypothetical predicted protein [Marmota monax]|uniref:Uncharacterized protein n=1 Tax=Marmota monax TaxID=9995 RepID=A0A5E4AZY6_MARMO|nr:Hypothetical predicted protein [Marmota monax]